MTKWAQFRGSRTSWGINVLGSFCVEIEATDGTKGFATGFGGPPACWLTEQHFNRFLIGAGMDYFFCLIFEPCFSQNLCKQILVTPTISLRKCTAPQCSTAARVCPSP
jgi:hypothetical protein